MGKKQIVFLYGINSVVSKKALADGQCSNQQDVVNAPLTAISARRGYLKKNTTALSGEINGVYGFKTKLYHYYIAVDSAGDVTTL